MVSNGVSFLMSFGMFGSIFLLSQFFQVVQGLNPLESGLRILPWTAMPIFVAPIAGVASARIGARPILVAGLGLMAVGLAWIAAVSSATVPYASLVPPFIIAGVGMGLFFAPIANVVLSAVPREDEGKASGANNTIRELGGVFGVAVLAAVFSANGSYQSPAEYVAGLTPAVAVGAAVVAISAVVALALPRYVRGMRSPSRRRASPSGTRRAPRPDRLGPRRPGAQCRQVGPGRPADCHVRRRPDAAGPVGLDNRAIRPGAGEHPWHGEARASGR